MLDVLAAMSVSLEAMFVEFVEILDALVEILEVFVLISDSTSVMVPRAKLLTVVDPKVVDPLTERSLYREVDP